MKAICYSGENLSNEIDRLFIREEWDFISDSEHRLMCGTNQFHCIENRITDKKNNNNDKAKLRIRFTQSSTPFPPITYVPYNGMYIHIHMSMKLVDRCSYISSIYLFFFWYHYSKCAFIRQLTNVCDVFFFFWQLVLHTAIHNTHRHSNNVCTKNQPHSTLYNSINRFSVSIDFVLRTHEQ